MAASGLLSLPCTGRPVRPHRQTLNIVSYPWAAIVRNCAHLDSANVCMCGAPGSGGMREGNNGVNEDSEAERRDHRVIHNEVAHK